MPRVNQQLNHELDRKTKIFYFAQNKQILYQHKQNICGYKRQKTKIPLEAIK